MKSLPLRDRYANTLLKDTHAGVQNCVNMVIIVTYTTTISIH